MRELIEKMIDANLHRVIILMFIVWYFILAGVVAKYIVNDLEKYRLPVIWYVRICILIFTSLFWIPMIIWFTIKTRRENVRYEKARLNSKES